MSFLNVILVDKNCVDPEKFLSSPTKIHKTASRFLMTLRRDLFVMAICSGLSFA